MKSVAITGTGLYTPPESISNDALVACFNAYAARFNAEHAARIEAGEVAAMLMSDAEFIVKASGIRSRHVFDRSGILDVDRMRPRIPLRSDDEPSLMAQWGLDAAREALAMARRDASEVDFIVVACSNLQRAYPAISVEIQHHLGASGFAYDMNVACASAAFGIQAAADAVRHGHARAALVISPELCSGHLNWRDRDSHFIFGDAATAVLIEPLAETGADSALEVLGTRLKTAFSNSIRNNFGFLNACETPQRSWDDVLFRQDGRKVFKDVVILASDLISGHLNDTGIAADSVRRFWLHQANLAMNHFIAKKVLGHEPDVLQAPVILDEYANTSSAGSVIALHKHREDLRAGDVGVLCAFGAGYSVGSVIVRKR